MATETKAGVVKVKSSGLDGSSKGKVEASVSKKKGESSSKQSVDAKQKSVSIVATKTGVTHLKVSFFSLFLNILDLVFLLDSQFGDLDTLCISHVKVKSKATSSSSKTTSTTTTKVREKKVYTLPGQKHDPPEEREPLRLFYESLSKQIPTSEMAEFWMMEHGLLSPERAKRAYEKKQRKQKQLHLGTPVKSPPPKSTSKPESSHKQQQASKNRDIKARKIINNDSDNDDGFILSPKRRKG
ncbi:hypothetical protein SLEP1_g52019 [Rubroshorea leprosula]|nr:hypothetical protein SLEP1_g52019 [Rubroshorea leprosula]